MRHAPIDPALFVAHRRQLRELLPKNCVVVVPAADVLPTSGDGTLRLRPASELFWLSGIEQEESVLVLAPMSGPFAPGWVITVEPGIYIPDEGIGIRLENDILITADGPIDLCSYVPIEPDEIESLLQ